MKKILITFLLASFLMTVRAQSIEKDVPPFTKVLIGPGVNVELIKSNDERIRLVSDSEKLNDIKIEVENDVLKVYFKYSKFDIDDEEPFANSKYTLSGTPYEGIVVYAKLYFKQLDGIDFRGEGKLFCKDELAAEDFDLKIYGDNEVKLSEISAQSLNAAFYGDNEVEVLKGKVNYFKIKTYGENTVDASRLRAEEIRLTSMGESDIDVHAESLFKVKVIGEGDISYTGDPEIKEFNLGEARIHKLD